MRLRLPQSSWHFIVSCPRILEPQLKPADFTSTCAYAAKRPASLCLFACLPASRPVRLPAWPPARHHDVEGNCCEPATHLPTHSNRVHQTETSTAAKQQLQALAPSPSLYLADNSFDFRHVRRAGAQSQIHRVCTLCIVTHILPTRPMCASSPRRI